MENAADALKIAFAIFVFVIAITITFSLVSQMKETADTVLYYSDKTNYYSHLEAYEENRTVSVAEVVSTLYRINKESLCVTVHLKNGGITTFNSAGDNIEEYINNNLLTNDNEFKEEFTEVPISGIYETGEDNTEIVLSSGMKKVYITYTEI